MSIELIGVSKRTRKTITPVIYENLNIRIEHGDHVALLGPKGSGLDLIVGLICGADAPDRGRVVRTSSISWPIPNTNFMHKHLNFVGNARFIARLYGLKPSEFVPKVLEMANLGEFVNERLDHCPKDLIGPFSAALGLCLSFDLYLLRSASLGGKANGDRFQAIIADLQRDHGLVIATSQAKGVSDLCDKAYVFDSGKAVYYDDVEEALDHLKRIATKQVDEEEEIVEVPEEDLVDDFF